MTNAFVYKWTDNLTNKIYIGYHKGNVDDGYICSSKYMMPEYIKRPNDFVREILMVGLMSDCFEYEQFLIKNLMLNKIPTYNKALGGTWNIDDEIKLKTIRRGSDNGNWNRKFSIEHKEKMSISLKKRYANGELNNLDRLNWNKEYNQGNQNPAFGKPQSKKQAQAIFLSKCKTVITNLGIFANQTIAAKHHNVSQPTMFKWLKLGKAEYA
jgi:hypothetical protein